MPLKSRRPTPQSERGAVAVIVAALTTILLVVAALGVDLASQVQRKHLLINQLDSASTAAAFELGSDGSIADSVAAAQAYFAANGLGTLDLHDLDFWCVVARKLDGNNNPLTPEQAADYQIPTTASGGGTCNPDAASSSTRWHRSEYQNRQRAWDGRRFSMTCNNTLCAVPCALQAGPGNSWNPGNSLANNRAITCNTIRVGAEQDVPFSFAPVMGIDEGSTGAQLSVACAGSCGEVAPNPLDVVVVADRTGSMDGFRDDLVAGIKSMLQVMTPEQQYVALGAIGPSNYGRKTSPTAESLPCSTNGLTRASGSASGHATRGGWVPIPFRNDYLGNVDSSGARSLNTSSSLVSGVECLINASSTGTVLATPLKFAARYVLGLSGDDNNIAALGGSDRSGEPQKVIIFETDGEPNESPATTTGAVDITNSSEIFSKSNSHTASNSPPTLTTSSGTTSGKPSSASPAPPSPWDDPTRYPNTYTSGGNSYNYSYNYRTATSTRTETRSMNGGQKACENFLEVARQAKAQDILVITIGYNLGGVYCSRSNSVSLPAAQTTQGGAPWISQIAPTACRGAGSGTKASPYAINNSCRQNMTITYTVPQDRQQYASSQASGDKLITEVLAAAAGGTEFPASTSNGCVDSTSIAAENSDGDLFYCAAEGDDLAPLFVTALGSVTGGVKLIRLP